jgi:hypothetical protein
MNDFEFTDHGSVCLLFARSEDAKVWVADRLSDDAMDWAGGIVIERNYVRNILAGLRGDGLSVEAI